MRIGILTRNMNSWSSTQLREALKNHSISYECFSFPELVARVGVTPYLNTVKGRVDVLEDFDGLVIRPIGRGSLEEIVFRMDVLYRLQRLGLYVVNPPEAIEHCVDKYDILTILEENGIRVPKTVVTEDENAAARAFKELGEDVVVKPVFGSRGVGATRIRNSDVASSVFHAIRFYHGVIYIQEFIHHGFSDIRALVVGDRVISSMRRVATGWKSNYSQGARPEPLELDADLEELAVKSAMLIDCKIAGVDILEDVNGHAVIEVNSQPGWKGLQSVSKTRIADEIVSFLMSELKK